MGDDVQNGTQQFSQIVAVGDTVTLEETSNNPLGEIGPIIIAPEGDFFVADGLAPSVKHYNARGQFLHEIGRYGDGPFEFRRITGIARQEDGIIIADDRLRRFTMVNFKLQPDTIIHTAVRPAGRIVVIGNNIATLTAPANRSIGLAVVDKLGQPNWQRELELPNMAEFPYWNSYARVLLTASPSRLFTAYSFKYPVHARNLSGEVVDSVFPSPANFRVAPVLRPGALAGPDAERERDKWLSSFDVIAEMVVLRDSLLVVAHGVTTSSRQSGSTSIEQQWLDVYNARTLQQVASRLSVPHGTRLLPVNSDILWFGSVLPPWKLTPADLR